MDRKPLSVLLFLCCFVMLTVPLYGAEKPSCAFLSLHVDEGSTVIGESEGKDLTIRFTEALDLLDVYDVLASSEMSRNIAMRKGLGATPCTNLACAVEYGKLLNVDYVIYGIYGHIDNVYSVETILVDVESNQEIKHVVTDYKGDHQGVIEKIPLENLKTLLGMAVLPHDAEAAYARMVKGDAETDKKAVAKKPLRFGPRLGLVASDDGVELGGGIEVRFNNLSVKIMGNDAGIGGALSYYLNVEGNSPYLAVAGAYYDDKNKGLTEIGRIYGLMLGYRLMVVNENMDVCIGLGAAYVDWDHKQYNAPTKSDQEIIPVGELTFGYMF
ncbi:MAG: hypothetical protein C4548_07760 [Desulfobacteraceae bacterium]|nr:MAG: hypothetical protein C4548_07760 [Desulfobacteraceae bacterium]